MSLKNFLIATVAVVAVGGIIAAIAQGEHEDAQDRDDRRLSRTRDGLQTKVLTMHRFSRRWRQHEVSGREYEMVTSHRARWPSVTNELPRHTGDDLDTILGWTTAAVHTKPVAMSSTWSDFTLRTDITSHPHPYVEDVQIIDDMLMVIHPAHTRCTVMLLFKNINVRTDRLGDGRVDPVITQVLRLIRDAREFCGSGVSGLTVTKGVANHILAHETIVEDRLADCPVYAV